MPLPAAPAVRSPEELSHQAGPFRVRPGRGPPPGPLAQEAAAEPPPPTRRWWFWTAVGAGVLALAGGAVAYYASGQTTVVPPMGPRYPGQALMPSRGMPSRRLAALVLVLAGAAALGCQRDKTVTQSGLTGLEVTVSYDPALQPSSLAISGTVDGASAFTPGALPDPPRPLQSGHETAVILLPETLAGKTVVAGRRSRWRHDVGSAQESVRVERAKLAKVALTLGAPAICGDNAVRAGIRVRRRQRRVGRRVLGGLPARDVGRLRCLVLSRRLLRGRLLPAGARWATAAPPAGPASRATRSRPTPAPPRARACAAGVRRAAPGNAAWTAPACATA